MGAVKGEVYLIGAGFVADLYMRSLKAFPGVKVAGVADIDSSRLNQFSQYWDVPVKSVDDILELAVSDSVPRLVLNLTNPSAHFAVSKAVLEAGAHLYSEKPLAMGMSEARALCSIAEQKKLLLGSAPCSWLSDSARTIWEAIDANTIGQARLIYAELDDDFILQAPYNLWASESGAPWPARDEFEVGCTLEHAGYYLTWLMAIFGPVSKVVAASGELLPEKMPGLEQAAPDFSTAVLFFKSGVVARLTCSIIAPHDHSIRIIGDEGVIELGDCWDNHAVVRRRSRFTLRRRLVNNPIARRLKLSGQRQPKTSRFGAASMNFALGPVHLLKCIEQDRAPALSADFSLHVNEVTLAIQNAGDDQGAQIMTTDFKPIIRSESFW